MSLQAVTAKLDADSGVNDTDFAATINALKEFDLLTSPSNYYSTLTSVKVGTPVNVIKVWESNESGNWLLVSVLCQNFDQLFYRRGWVEI